MKKRKSSGRRGGEHNHFMARRWLMRVPQSRALKITPQGKRALLPIP